MPLLRFVSRDHFTRVIPIVTLVDDGERVVTWQPPGSTMMNHTGQMGGPRRRNMVAWDGGYEAVIWTGPGLLRAHRVGDPWSVWRWESDTDWSPGFYVNLEAPWRRSEVGFDTGDWILDLVVEPDGSVTRKDEDELAASLERGGMTQDEVDTAEAAAAAATEAVSAGSWPFAGDWDTWFTLRTTEPLTLPTNWDAGFEPGPGRD